MRKKLLLFVLAALLIVLVLLKIPDNSQSDNTNIAPKEQSQQTEGTEDDADSVKLESRMLFTGDVFWGRQVHQLAQNSSLKEAFPFSGLNSFEREKYDAWIGVLECPITDGFVSYQNQIDFLKFNCRPEYMPEVAKWFDAFTLASNHTDNMEEINGFQQTQDYLEEYDIQYFGHYENMIIEDICEVVSIASSEERTLPVALCGYNSVYKLPSDEALKAVQEYSKYYPTIALPQQGAEYQTSSDAFKREVYRNLIDYGADVVIGGQPHTVQETESYKGKLIVYSVGNFMFDQRFDNEVTRGIAVDLTLSVSVNQDNLMWLEQPNCQEYKDSCLEFVKSSDLNKPAMNFEFKLVPVDNGGTVTAKGNQQIYNWALQRTAWDQTLKQLNY